MISIFLIFFIYTKSISDATICNQDKIIIPMGYNVFDGNETMFKYTILFNQFEMIIHDLNIFDFFIYTKSISDATICKQSKIIIPTDPMFSIEMKGRLNILYFSQLLKKIIHDLNIFDFFHMQQEHLWCDTM